MSFTPSIAVDTVEQSAMPISNGKTLYVGGSGPGNYTLIQDAIDNASDGDTVFVYNESSPYYENIEIDKSINLIGEDRDTTVIDGGGEGDVVKITADWVIIYGFTVQNSAEDILNAGIKIDSSYNTISANNITSNGVGINPKYSTNNIFSNNYLSNNLCGILQYYSMDSIITRNTYTNNSYGINNFHSSNSNITLNKVSNNRIGIRLGHSISDIIMKNNIRLNEYCGISLDYSTNNKIMVNNITLNFYCGIIVRPLSDSNTIISNNISSNDDYGIYLRNSSNNTIYHNNFINNRLNAYDECNNTWDDGYPSGGNFWDDYFGTDSNGDGIGDTPYNIAGGDNIDRYPLGNFRPDKPDIDGPPNGNTGTEYEYTFNAVDHNNDDVYYHINWGDGSFDMTAFSPSGIDVRVKHIWNESGDYTIIVIAVDTYGAVSDWGILEVTMPRNRATVNSLFQLLLDRFPLLEVFLRAMNLLR